MKTQAIDLQAFDNQPGPVIGSIVMSNWNETPSYLKSRYPASYLEVSGNSSDISQMIHDRLVTTSSDTLIIDFHYIDSKYLRGSNVDYVFRHFIDQNMLEKHNVKRIILLTYSDHFALGPVVMPFIQKLN